MCVISGEKNDNVNVEEKSGIVQVTIYCGAGAQLSFVEVKIPRQIRRHLLMMTKYVSTPGVH